MRTVDLRHRIPYEEFDYQELIDALSGYAQPRSKITALLRSGDVVRVKKGLYVFGEVWRRQPIRLELLANRVYGPSYLSLEYALSWHGLIPERVDVLTSVTCGRARIFDTPVGRFSYRALPLAAYRVGIDQQDAGDGRFFLVATREKAVADSLVAERGGLGSTCKAVEAYLVEERRIERDHLKELDPARLAEIAVATGSRRVSALAAVVTKMRKGRDR